MKKLSANFKCKLYKNLEWSNIKLILSIINDLIEISVYQLIWLLLFIFLDVTLVATNITRLPQDRRKCLNFTLPLPLFPICTVLEITTWVGWNF